jgi:tetratricopeptide (TPR) repeat protein
MNEDYKAAIENAQLALSFYKEDKHSTAELYGIIGVANNDLGDYRNAIDAFTTAISYEPDESKFYYQRARTFIKIKDTLSAIPDFKRTSELDTCYTSFIRLCCLTYLKREKEALKIMDEVYLSSSRDFYAGRCDFYPSKQDWRMVANYYFARLLSLLDRKDMANMYLEKAIHFGKPIKEIEKEWDFDNIRNTSSYIRYVTPGDGDKK